MDNEKVLKKFVVVSEESITAYSKKLNELYHDSYKVVSSHAGLNKLGVLVHIAIMERKI